MANDGLDCATVLEQFIHDSANLPAEVNYMMEELEALDKEASRVLASARRSAAALEKQVKNDGSLSAHPKEAELIAQHRRDLDTAIEKQKKKLQCAEKALVTDSRHTRRFDSKLRSLYETGQIEDHEGYLSGLFARMGDYQKSQPDAPAGNLPLQAASANALNTAAVRANSQVAPTIRQPVPRQIQQIATAVSQPQRNSAPTTPAIQPQKQSQEREQSLGADSKRRKLNMTTTGINLPAQASSLRQGSLGPGTPKAGTPTGSRAGSIPRTTGPAKKAIAGVINKKAPHQKVNQLKNKHIKHVRLSQSGRKTKSGSPAVRGGRAGTEASEDSVLSSAEASDTDTSQARRKRNKKATHHPEPQTASEEEDEGDDKRYCYCNQPSYGEMVGCENENCPREWFHLSCLSLKQAPEDEEWYCPECRTEAAAGGNKKRK